MADGRYLAREGGDEGLQRVLVIETLGAPPPPARRRRRPRPAEQGTQPQALPLTRATAIRAFEPFESPEDAAGWLQGAIASEAALEVLVGDAIGLLNRALHVQAVASASPRGGERGPEGAVLARVGYGSGQDLAGGRFAVAHEIDLQGGQTQRRRREDELQPQERVAAVLGGRERLDACETLLLRARADLDAGRLREAALQLRVALEALLAELAGALVDPGHEEDMAQLEARRSEAGEAANMALRGDLPPDQAENVPELVSICERVLRRRRVLAADRFYGL